MALDEKTRSLITDCVGSLPNWSEYAGHAAIVLTGSFAAGLADEQSDIDVEVLLPEPAHSEMYEPLCQAVDEGSARILNPRARLFHEYPITYIPGVDGHYQIKSANVVETRIRAMDDVIRWIYSNSEAIADPGGLHRRLRELAADYPANVLREKRSRELFVTKDYFYGLKTQLQRDHRESILLVCTQSMSHLLKYFCLCDEKPFPYEKWLYQVALNTTLGRRVRRHVQAIVDELGRDSVVRERPQSYVKPGGRNEQFEEYRLYHLFMLVFEEVEASRMERYPDEVK